jgi:hypothetical protein
MLLLDCWALRTIDLDLDPWQLPVWPSKMRTR